ncbi:MAG: DegT/DnrJ/EryC1/StrS family aminotransferase [Bacteroidales bacterium]|nr:DegT/DnrJ/EryC1/StrS family aminotransferase [Bacteroidales bacterium]
MPQRIPIAQPSLLGREREYVMDALDTGWISSIGPFIDRFEHAFAEYHGIKHAITTHNGTIALHLALVAAGIGPGDEVIIPDLTFVATANAVRYCQAVPVLTDVNPLDWNIDLQAIREKITPKTKAIIPVHLYGNPVLMEELVKLAGEHHLLIIEDCAEAIGALVRNRKVGTFGHISCFSFFGNKVITTGEGGMCITNDDSMADKMRILRDHGMNRGKRYWYDVMGFNYRMTNMQAAVGVAQMEQLDFLLMERDRIYAGYHEKLSSCSQILFQDTHGNRNINWLFTLRVKGFTGQQRDLLMTGLLEAGIDSRPVFYPIHQLPYYQETAFSRGTFPVSDRISREGISLPTFVGLSQEQLEFITETLIRIIETL